MVSPSFVHASIASHRPVPGNLRTLRNLVRLPAILVLARDQRETAQVSPRHIASQGPASDHLYEQTQAQPNPRFPLTPVLPDIIDTKSQEIRPQDGEVYSKMEDLADDLPETSPRFILLSHPLNLVSSGGPVTSLDVISVHGADACCGRTMVVSPSLTPSSTGSRRTATRRNG